MPHGRNTTATPWPCCSRRLGHPQVTSHRRSVVRCPVHRFLFLRGWLRRRLYERIVPFAHPIGCGQLHPPTGRVLSAVTGVQAIQLSAYAAWLPALWPTVLGLQQALSLHATVPPSLSVGGKKLLYSPCLSEVAVAGNRRSWASLGALRLTI